MEKIRSINVDVLKWARLKSNVDHDAIVRCMHNDNYILWEKGIDYPTYAQLETLMNLYKFPIAIVFFSDIPEYDDIKVNFRTIPKDVIDNINYKIVRFFNKAKAFQMNIKELDSINDEIDLKSSILGNRVNSLSFEDKKILISSMSNDFSLMKKRIRSDKEFLEYWREELFQYGVYVFKDSFQDDQVSGFSIYDEYYPIIYINNGVSFSRQVFTLFHELYHLLSNTNGIDFISDEFLEEYKYDLNVEFECNKFAGEFLVPEVKLRESFLAYGNDISFIKDIAKRFYVSRDVILRRLLDTKLISYKEYNDNKELFQRDFLRVRNNISGKQQGSYYNNQMTYLGEPYLELTFFSYYKNLISLYDLGKFTNLKYKSLMQIADIKGWQTL